MDTVIVACDGCDWTASAKPGDLVLVRRRVDTDECLDHEVRRSPAPVEV